MKTLKERFETFHSENPHVYNLLVELALKVKNEYKFKKFSIDYLFHQIRWEYSVKTSDPDFKLNDHYTAFYSRLIMNNISELDGFFRTRTQTSQIEE